MDLDASLDMAVDLLKELIRIPSVSRDEKQAADLMEEAMKNHGLPIRRKHNNVWTEHRISGDKPNILLNSHVDTVKPVEGWTRDPYLPGEEGDRIPAGLFSLLSWKERPALQPALCSKCGRRGFGAKRRRQHIG